MNSDRVIVLVMAAGHGRRFGSDKRTALLPGGKGLLASTVAQAQKALPHVYAVLKEDEQPEAFGLPPETPCIRLAGTSAGLGESLAHVFGRLIHDPRFATFQSAFVWLGDMPWIEIVTCHQILAAADSHRIVRPCHAGKPGHPVGFGRDFWPELAGLKGLEGGRTIIAMNKTRCVEVNVADGNINVDIDVPADIDH
ncbi:nucleotidyltransferase family protein [Pistricoccus aurantiacus]|uniref:nucleotidyltransferase family protein n=1 Tax=Pistricoccus aurantiacus TaxID=1883414 RepID=UPI0036320A6C